MLVHDIRKNETRVIDFRETAPSGITEEMLQTNLDLNVRHLMYSLLLLGRNSLRDHFIVIVQCCS